MKLSSILDELKIDRYFIGESELCGSFNLAVQQLPGTIVYLPSLGELTVERPDDGEAVHARAGDAIILPRGDRHRLVGGEQRLVTVAVERLHKLGSDAVLDRFHFGAGQPGVCFLALRGCWDGGSNAIVTQTLPRLIHVPAAILAEERHVGALTEIARGEAARLDHVYRHAVVTRLVNVIILKLLGTYLRHCGGSKEWERSVEAPPVAHAISLMRSALELPWTYDAVARQVGVSRSALVSLFGRTLGKTPWEFLTELRMERAGELLREGEGHIKIVAARVGYDSVPSFVSAFKRFHGMTPGDYRALHFKEVGLSDKFSRHLN